MRPQDYDAPTRDLGKRLVEDAVSALVSDQSLPDVGWAEGVIERLSEFAPKGHAKNLGRLLDDTATAYQNKTDLPNFGDRFRSVFPGQDEQFSTAASRELFQGAVAELVSSQLLSRSTSGMFRSELAECFYTMFTAMSLVRFATEWTGFKFASGESMQHPQSGMFGENKAHDPSWSLHWSLDLARRVRALDAMLEEELQADSTASSTILAGLREVVLFSSNEFLAPGTASDQRIMPEYAKDARPQAEAREARVKDVGVSLGLEQEPGVVSFARPYGDRSGSRLLSPKRAEQSEDALDEDSMDVDAEELVDFVGRELEDFASRFDQFQQDLDERLDDLGEQLSEIFAEKDTFSPAGDSDDEERLDFEQSEFYSFRDTYREGYEADDQDYLSDADDDEEAVEDGAGYDDAALMGSADGPVLDEGAMPLPSAPAVDDVDTSDWPDLSGNIAAYKEAKVADSPNPDDGADDDESSEEDLESDADVDLFA